MAKTDTSDIRLGAEALERLTKELDPKLLRRAVKNALRKEARRLKGKAAKELGKAAYSKGKLRNSKAIGKTIRAKEMRDLGGLVVSAGFRGKAGFYKNSRGKLKPVAFWLDQGAKARTVRKTKKSSGSLPTMAYMEKVKRAEMGNVARNLGQAYEEQIRKIVKKINRQ